MSVTTPKGPPRLFDDDVFARLEHELGLKTPDDGFRDRVSRIVFDYHWSCQQRLPKKSAVRKRLEQVGRAAAELRQLLNEDPDRTAARANLGMIFKKLLGRKVKAPKNFFALVDAEIDALPRGKMKTYLIQMRANVDNASSEFDAEGAERLRTRALIIRNSAIDLDDLSTQLEHIVQFVASREKSSGGRPGFNYWDDLMLALAVLFEEITGSVASVTENEHKAYADERYAGAFVRFATVVDRETAEGLSYLGVQSRRNSALGPALRRLLQRRARKRNKTI